MQKMNFSMRQQQGTLFTGCKQEQVLVSRAGDFILIVIGDSHEEISALSGQLRNRLVP